MNTIKLKSWNDIPQDYTGIIDYTNGDKDWHKNGKLHREDGPARIRYDGYKEWHLDGKGIWNSYGRLDLTNKIILSKTQHSLYPIVQIWKILNKNKVYEQTVIPGMEEFIIE